MIEITLNAILQQYDIKAVLKQTDLQKRRFLLQAGGFVRTTARRSLRKARKIRRSELPDEDREEFDEAMEDFRLGHSKSQPKLRDIISNPGEAPLLHSRSSPLKKQLVFVATKDSVIVGPERRADGIAGDLEHGTGDVKKARPFMGPAFEKFLPRLHETYRKATT